MDRRISFTGRSGWIANNIDIVGVMPRNFAYPYRTVKAWVPLERHLNAETLHSHGDHVLMVIGASAARC